MPAPTPIGRNMVEFFDQIKDWCIYLRADRRFVCLGCYSETAKGPVERRDSCTRCWGLGFRVTPQIVPLRIIFGEPSGTWALIGEVTLQPGMAVNVAYKVIFPRNVYPAVGDVFLMCEWDMHPRDIGSKPGTPTPVNIVQSFRIKEVFYRYESEVGWFVGAIEDYKINMKRFRDSFLELENPEIIVPGF